MGEPGHLLCWTLALYRTGHLDAATHRLRRTMLSNLYVIPYLLGELVDTSDDWHGLIQDEPSYLEEIPPEYFDLWDADALQWLQETYQSDALRHVRERYIEIDRQLETESPGPKRSQLVQEAFELQE